MPRIKHPLQANWKPLEAFINTPEWQYDGRGHTCEQFMWMNVSGHPTDPHEDIELYKHIDTRRYLNLDADGHSYTFDSTTGEYKPINPVRAIIHIFGA